MERHTLTVKKRTIFGKKVKKIRSQGELPANIYGKGIKSEAVSIQLKNFQKVYRKVGETGLVLLTVENEPKERPVLFHNLQLDPATDNLLHVDCYQVDLKEKVTAKIPVATVGSAKAVSDKIGVLLQPLLEIEIEALPSDLPEKIEIDVSKLSQVDEALFVKDIQVDKEKINVLTNPEEIIVKIGRLITKEMEAQIAAEKEAAEAAAASAEAAAPTEGAAPAPTEAPSESKGEGGPAPEPKKEENSQ